MDAHALLLSCSLLLQVAVDDFAPAQPMVTALVEPTTQPADTLRKWLSDLAADDGDQRRSARRNLLKMSRQDLSVIRDLIAAGAAPQPAQRQALYEIVCHVFLATEPYPGRADTSFFGIFDYRAVDLGNSTGLVFAGRLIGFPAYASLEDGDVILGILEKPKIDLRALNPLESIRATVKPGETIHVRVLRDNQVIITPLTLAPSPSWPRPGVEERTMREQLANEYWQRQFAPLWNNGNANAD
jgi:hypothetical protein